VVLKKVAATAIGVFAIASMLMVFDSVRQFGASILASAGVAGVVVGFAAQRSIATLLAGFQIALTQPIRVDDVVIVEHEWGRIEEITFPRAARRVCPGNYPESLPRLRASVDAKPSPERIEMAAAAGQQG